MCASLITVPKAVVDLLLERERAWAVLASATAIEIAFAAPEIASRLGATKRNAQKHCACGEFFISSSGEADPPLATLEGGTRCPQ
jgi:hypothetical protein